jgi:hypothetical protein
MPARICVVLSASILFALGAIHLVYTFWGPNLHPRENAVEASMMTVSPVLTTETTMWRCWTGFNVTHSMCLLFFGLVFGYLALAQHQLLFRSPFLILIGAATLASLVVVCKLYFFRAPLLGVATSLVLYVVGIALSRA